MGGPRSDQRFLARQGSQPGRLAGSADLRHTGVVKTASRQPGMVLPRSADAIDARTRDRVTQLLIELGPCTAAELSQRLGLSPAGIRRHLDAMCATGAISARTPRVPAKAQRGRGRPAKHYALTDAGHAAGPSAYDELATSALGFLAEHGGDDAIGEFARRRAAELAERVSARLETVGQHRCGRARSGAHRGGLRGHRPSRGHRHPAVPAPLPGAGRRRSSSRSCATRRRRRCPSCSTPTSSGSPPSPTATASAPLTFQLTFPRIPSE